MLKKIILTTDETLIKDGVQEIDKEFLEWLDKNPSCEFVEIDLQHQYHSSKQFYDNADFVNCTKEQYNSIKKGIPTCPLRILYKIIIPKEELKSFSDFADKFFGSNTKEELKLINNCPKCGLDLVERKYSKPVCTRIDCGGIILSNETLKEFAAKKQEEPKQDLEKEMFELEQELDIPSHLRWHNSKPKQETFNTKRGLKEVKLKDFKNCENYKEIGCIKDICDCYTLITETLEEAAENYANKKGDIPTTELEDAIFKQGFIDGAKWQQEKMYSEEDVIDLLIKMNSWLTIFEGKEDIIEWFEQFKKK
jgi:hypothetical protein